MRTWSCGLLRCPPLLLLLTASLWPCVGSPASSSGNPQRFEYHALRMGTEFRLVLFAGTESQARKAATEAFDEIERLEQVISDYREGSELVKVERVAWTRPKVISPELYQAVSVSLRMSRLTGGAFDISVKPVVELWREARRTNRIPGPSELKSVLALVGFEKVLLNPRMHSLRLAEPGMRLDFGGVGKGLAADLALAVLGRHGISRALVDAGGDLRLGSAPPGEAGWRIEIQNGDAVPLVVRLAEVAVATSGDQYQFVEVAGERYSHIVDPRTGLGVRHSGMVTVIARDGATADALATALSVLEANAGLRLVERLPGTEARILRKTTDEDHFEIRSRGFPP